MNKKISCVICAYNEGPRIKNVLDVVVKSNILDEIIVVDDGSTDNTAKVASKYPKVKLISYRPNKGKGNAMFEGISDAKNDIIILLDADFINLQERHLKLLIENLMQNQSNLILGMIVGGKNLRSFFKKFGQITGAFVSGFKCFNRNQFQALQKLRNNRFEGDVILCNDFLRRGKKVKIVPISDLTFAQKYEKVPFFKALTQYLQMYVQFVRGFLILPSIPTNKESIKNFFHNKVPFQK